MPEIIGVQFQRAGKIYYFDSLDEKIEKGSHVIVETSRGIEYAYVALDTHWIPEEDLEVPLKPIIRVATAEDAHIYEENLRAAKEAYAICQEKIELCQLSMKLVNVEYTFDCGKVIFNFTADERVDFRELIKELAAVFHTRIELRQIGVRDEAKIVGGVGICGQPLCCHRFLTDFLPVSIKMAKEQNLSLNPTKISGCCGRLLCCLNYENAHYVESNRLAREAAKAAKQNNGGEEAPAVSSGDASAPKLAFKHEEQAFAFDYMVQDDTEVTIESYYDPSLIASTSFAIQSDDEQKRKEKGQREKRPAPRTKEKKTGGKGEYVSRDESHDEEKHQKSRKSKRAHEADNPPTKREYKVRKRGSRGGRNRNKQHDANKSNPTN